MDDTQTHTKKVWRYFILCCILFCTHARCSRPLHQLITNVVESVVESQGSSALLIKILNRLGVTMCIRRYTFPLYSVQSTNRCLESYEMQGYFHGFICRQH